MAALSPQQAISIAGIVHMARDFMFLQREEGNKTRCEMARSAAATFIDATMTGGRRNGTAIELYHRSIRLVLAY